ncbi:unnamed protein product [Lymnaea stagnalis]|uniref:Uncharacterized protein n=1 Tax=Lymnaea stagnalis TaxID=6523 RepID=A0AAV2I2I3_LYMST
MFLEVVAKPDTWCNSDLQPVSKTDPLAVCLKLKQPGFCTGDLHMRPLAEKVSELAVQTLIFSVIHGKICFTLNGISTIVDSGVDFFIPRGNYQCQSFN